LNGEKIVIRTLAIKNQTRSIAMSHFPSGCVRSGIIMAGVKKYARKYDATMQCTEIKTIFALLLIMLKI
jgi:hypothetical protein